MEELAWALGFMPGFITIIVTMAVISSFLREVVFDCFTEAVESAAPAVASAAAAVASAAAVVAFFGLPGSLTLLFLGVASAAFWDDKGEVPAVVIVEEYLDEGEMAEIARTELAKAVAREAMAKARIRELEARILQLENRELYRALGSVLVDAPEARAAAAYAPV